MPSQLHDVYTEVSSHNIDIFVVTEKWLHEGNFHTQIFDDRYHTFRRDRCTNNYFNTKKDGVLLIVIQKKFKAQRVKDFESDLKMYGFNSIIISQVIDTLLVFAQYSALNVTIDLQIEINL